MGRNIQYNLQAGVIQREFKKAKRLAIGIVASLGIVGAFAMPAFAAGNGNNGPTVGDCISDGFYGNEPNMANGAPGGPSEQAPGDQAGNVTPSQSPGPTKTLPDGTVEKGNSVGDYQQMGISIPEACRTLTQ